MGALGSGMTAVEHKRPFGDYVLERVLGRGGMAEVFLAQRSGPGGARRYVALKRILPSYADAPDRVKRFVDEMRVAVTLQHRNVVTVLDFGEVDGTYFLALELVRGMDLRTLTEKLAEQAQREGQSYPGQERGVLPPAVVAWVGMQAAEGLAYAHRHRRDDGQTGLLHRDISPDNLMVDIYGEVKINDWGIAKSLKDDASFATATDHAYGKPVYAPPEQSSGKPLDTRADLYALGVSLFKLLAGHTPFETPGVEDEHPWAKVARSYKDERPPMAQMLPGLPPALPAVLEAVVQADPTRRLTSAEQMALPLKEVTKELAGDLDAAQKMLGRLVASVYQDRTSSSPELIASRGTPAPVSIHPTPTPEPPQPAAAVSPAPSSPAVRTAAFPQSDSAPAPREPSPGARPTWMVGAVALALIVFAGVGIAAVTFAYVSRRPTVEASPEAAVVENEAVENEAVENEVAANEAPAGEVRAPAAAEPPSAEPPLAEVAPAHPPETTPEQENRNPADAVADEGASDAVMVVAEGSPSPGAEPAPDAEEPDEAQEYGTLRVVVIPMGTVTVDGRDRGPSPVRVRVRPGRHSIVAQHPGFSAARTRVSVEPGRTRRVNLRLQ